MRLRWSLFIATSLFGLCLCQKDHLTFPGTPITNSTKSVDVDDWKHGLETSVLAAGMMAEASEIQERQGSLCAPPPRDLLNEDQTPRGRRWMHKFKETSQAAWQAGQVEMEREGRLRRTLKKNNMDMKAAMNDKSAQRVMKQMFEQGMTRFDKAESGIEAKQAPINRGGRFCVNRDQPSCDPAERYRSFDGWCNNLKLPFWGAALTPHIRVTPARYQDGQSAPRVRGVNNIALPNPRFISTRLSQGADRRHPTVTLMTVHFGQFLDHDFVNTPITLVQNNGQAAPPQCCNVAPNCRDPSCFPIEISKDDPFYGKFQVQCMEFVRSLPAPRPDCTVGPREQMNQNSHFIDLSHVYGSTADENTPVRAFQRGGLKINTSPLAVDLRMMLMPPERDTLDCQKLDESRTCFKAGDNRVNIQTALTALHTVFLREHNRISDFLWSHRQDLPDDILFQETRKIMIAQFQAIVYSEFVPVLVGDRIAMDNRNQIRPVPEGFFTGYNENVNPGTWIEMSTAAYRLHTLIQDWLPLKRSPRENFTSFHEFFFMPYYMYEPGALDNLVEGLCVEKAQGFDTQISKEMTQHLFQAAGEPFGLDILALNIQRGRDHGLATYNDVREFCGLPRARRWTDLEDVMQKNRIQALFDLYKEVDNIDFYIGGLSENPVNRGDGLVGPTFACILTGQFRDWRIGDRFWYENPGQFSAEQLDEIRKVSLAGIICANSNIKMIQPRVFLDAKENLNPRMPCERIPQMDLSKFLTTLPRF